MSWTRFKPTDKGMLLPGNRMKFGIIITAALLMLLLTAIQYLYMRNNMVEQLEENAESELMIKQISIARMLRPVRIALENNKTYVYNSLDNPDSLFAITRNVVRRTPDVKACAISFRPDYYPEKGKFFEPASIRQDDGSIKTCQLGSNIHDYTKTDFYTMAIKGDSSRWTSPYYDEAGDSMWITSYAIPIRSKDGGLIAVFTIDVSIDWLGQRININHIHQSSYDILFTRSGQLIAEPEIPDNPGLKPEEAVKLITDSTVERTKSFIGNSKVIKFEAGKDKRKGQIFYNTFLENTDWVTAVVCYDKDIYATLYDMGSIVVLLMVAGLVLLAMIIHYSIKNIQRLNKVNSEKTLIDNELSIAHATQQQMLPHDKPQTDLFNLIDIDGRQIPAREVAGDLYEYIERDGELLFCIGDVSGKGMPAALVMSVVISSFRSAVQYTSDTATIMDNINRMVSMRNDAGNFVTMFVARLNPLTRELAYCNAGHNPPMIIGRKTELMQVEPNLPAGVMEDFAYSEQQIKLKPDDTLLLYTDGVTEAKDSQHRMFGEKRMIEAARLCSRQSGFSCSVLLKKMVEAVESFTDNTAISDDLTLLAVRIRSK